MKWNGIANLNPASISEYISFFSLMPVIEIVYDGFLR
jgi:hypothetical protein